VLDLSQPVDALIGELAGSGWAGVRGTDVLAMASGIDCLEIDVPGGSRWIGKPAALVQPPPGRLHRLAFPVPDPDIGRTGC
jgi:hypothetical protein